MLLTCGYSNLKFTSQVILKAEIYQNDLLNRNWYSVDLSCYVDLISLFCLGNSKPVSSW